MIKKVIDKKIIFVYIFLFFVTQNIFAISSDFDEVYISNFLENQLLQMQDYKNQSYQEKIYREKYNQLHKLN